MMCPHAICPYTAVASQKGVTAFGWRKHNYSMGSSGSNYFTMQIKESPNAVKHTQIVLPTYCTKSPHHCLENHINRICCTYANAKQFSRKINHRLAQIIAGDCVWER